MKKVHILLFSVALISIGIAIYQFLDNRIYAGIFSSVMFCILFVGGIINRNKD